MSDLFPQFSYGSIGIVGFGAFGQLITEHLRPYFKISVFDIAPDIARADALGVSVAPFKAVAESSIVVLAIPVGRMREVVADLALLLKPGTLVLDVGSVKVEPVAIMKELLPETVGIVATHPLFGPQSAQNGIHGLQIAICPVRGPHLRVAALCRKAGLEVIMTTPDEHDRDAAQVQGLTHLIANLLVKMDLRQTRMTTRSFEAMMSAVEMVRHDGPEVLEAILGANPYASGILTRFKSLASALEEPT